MFEYLDIFDIFAGILTVLMAIFGFVLVITLFYEVEDERHRKNICWEKAYSEYIKDERCKKLLEN